MHVVPQTRDVFVELFHPGAEPGQFGLLLDDLEIVGCPRLFTARQLPTDFFEIVRKLPVIFVRKMRIEYPEVFHQSLVTTRLARLTLERADLSADLFDDILNPQQVRLRVFEFAERFPLLGLVFRYSRGFLKDRAPVFRPAAQDQVNLPLLHDRVGAPSHAGIHKKLVDVAQPARRLVEKILTLPVAINAPGDTNLIPFDAQFLFALGKSQRNFGHPKRLSAVGSAENHVRHLSSSQRLGRLFAEHPADGVKHVRFAAAVGSDDCRDAAVKVDDRPRRERFEANHLEGLKIHGHSSSLPGGKLSASTKLMARKNTIYCGCPIALSQPIEFP